MIDFLQEAQAMRQALVDQRRDLHMHPETAFEEVRTAAIVADELRRLGLEVQTGVGKTGVVALLEGEENGPTVLWRADMDALPIHEENVVPYASRTPGKMHACGHDGHTAIAMGLATLFKQHQTRMKGRIKFVFQPAEEIVGGAAAMIADGALADPRPDVALGLHLWNEAPLGKVGVADGPMMATSSRIEIDIMGKGGHAAMPHVTIDPVVCAAQIILGLQTIVSRSIDPAQTLVLSITQLSGSDADNVIPDVVQLRGTLRAFDAGVRDLATERIHAISASIATAMRCTASVQVLHGPPPVVNDASVAAKVRAALTQIVAPEAIDPALRTMAAEDVSLFMQDIPGTYFFVGAANSAEGKDYPHHHARFDFDEDALPLAVAMAAAAIGQWVL